MFSKNIKSMLIVAMLLLTVLGSVVLYADCDMMAMIVKNGYLISDIAEQTGNYNDPLDYFNWLRGRSTTSTKPNDDGYGIIYFSGNNSNINYIEDDIYNTLNQAWFLTGFNGYYYHGLIYNPNNSQNEAFNIAESMIMNNVNHSDDYPDLIDNNDCEAIILLGHARQGSIGYGSHPFRFEYDYGNGNSGTYILMHNGTLSGNLKNPFFNFLSDNGYLTANPSNWNPTPLDPYTVGEWIDSELLFRYLTYFIEENNGNIIEGINEAFSQTNIDNSDINFLLRDPATYSRVANFVLSDGNNLYAFRNAPLSDELHTMFYKDAGDFYSINTYDQPDISVEVPQYSFVVLSRDEEPIEYPNFLDIDVKVFASGYNWLSFPRLTEQGTSNEYLYEQAYYEGGLPGMFQLTSGGDPIITDFEKIIGHRLGADDDMNIYYDNHTGFSDQGFGNMLFRHEGYKVKVATGADPTILVVAGDRLPSDYELSGETLEANKYHWLGYWLPYSQDVDTAFGKGQGDDDFWQYVKVVKAENWTWMDMTYPRGTGDFELVPSMKIRSLEYGKAYLVKFSEDVDNFHWNDSNEVSEPERKKTTENFAYEEKADYEVIDVLEINPNITEIGVFEDDVCVGAVAMQDSAEQILVYSDNANRDPVPFTFEVTTGRGSSIPVKSYNTLNLQTGEYENRLIISGKQEYSIVKFGEQLEPEITINTDKLNGNYPNPFNPTTTISFSLPNEQNIELTVFNIKGQKVKTLYSGTADKGNHTMIWEGKDMNDKSVSSGLYFYKLKTNNNVLTRKMIMIK